MPKQNWRRQKELPLLEAYEEAIKIMMRHGGSLDDIAVKIGVPEDYLIGYLEEKGILEQLKNRSWSYKRKKYKRNIVKRKNRNLKFREGDKNGNT